MLQTCVPGSGVKVDLNDSGTEPRRAADCQPTFFSHIYHSGFPKRFPDNEGQEKRPHRGQQGFLTFFRFENCVLKVKRVNLWRNGGWCALQFRSGKHQGEGIWGSTEANDGERIAGGEEHQPHLSIPSSCKWTQSSAQICREKALSPCWSPEAIISRQNPTAAAAPANSQVFNF